MDLQSIAPLIARYSGNGPRYTSYPTAAQFAELSANAWEEILQKEVADSSLQSALSLYLHIPFCHQLCYFCACCKVIPKDRSVVPPFLRALGLEGEHYARIFRASNNVPPVSHLHLGGGSPNYLRSEEFIELFETLHRLFPRVGSPEYSIELDPRTTTEDQLQTLRSLSFSRVSIGVQDFDPRVQHAIHRLQSYEQTKDLCNAVREHGFDGLNIDLVYGLPEQEHDGFTQTLSRVIELRPDRIALYGYAHVPWMVKVQNAFRQFRIPTPPERLGLLLLAMEQLADAGYVHLGLDHFALPHDTLTRAASQGTMRRNFMGYTTDTSTMRIGLGPSAISSTNGAFSQNARELETYLQTLERGSLPTERGVLRSSGDRIRADVIERVLCSREIDLDRCATIWRIDPLDYFKGELSRLGRYLNDGLLVPSPRGYQVTDVGVFFLRNIAMEFDQYVQRHEPTVRYSQTV